MKTYIPFLTSFIIINNIKSVINLGCGDFRCGNLIYQNLENITYYGYDSYNALIEHNKLLFNAPKFNFFNIDLINDKQNIKDGDLCILKDVIQHWHLKSIYDFLDYTVENKKFKFILIINCCQQIEDNTDIKMGDWRPLSCNFLPLKKYNPIKILCYDTKEISLIKLN